MGFTYKEAREQCVSLQQLSLPMGCTDLSGALQEKNILHTHYKVTVPSPLHLPTLRNMKAN